MNQKLIYLTPLLAALGLGMILYTAIGKDPSKLETARLDDPIPNFELRALKDLDRVIGPRDFIGETRLLNVWATWCPSCKAEHPFLEKLAKQGIKIAGINYKDDRDSALTWLETLGDPYEYNIYDPKGTLGFDLGVYGAPETYIVDKYGVVRFRHVGELNARVWQSSFVPLLEKLNHQPAAVN